MAFLRYSLLLLLFPFLGTAVTGQRLVHGASFAVGTSWEVEYLPFGGTPTNTAGVVGAGGFELTLLLGYELGNLALTVRPGLLHQATMAYLVPRDDAMDRMEIRLYPNALLLPVRVDYRFGSQRIGPTLGVGGGFLADLSRRDPAATLRPEPILPYVEVAVGGEVGLGKLTLRPELTVRNGTGELFAGGRGANNGYLPGQRWAYVSFGVVVRK